jgi:predicted DsbA family dithiol-disulfide isomerase
MMKVEIWSDIVCPFCYIGKRRFELALAQSGLEARVEVVWKSFLLNPGIKTDPAKSINLYLSEMKGISEEQAKDLNGHVSGLAKEEGLSYDFEKAIPANSFNAHRLLQLAKTKGQGAEMEEQLFKAYFTDGKNIDDEYVLIELGADIGLDPSAISKMLNSEEFTDMVEQDLYEARQIGVNAVPYFVFDDLYAVRGAQSVETFLGALTRAWEERNLT